jgi:hypothetical protein
LFLALATLSGMAAADRPDPAQADWQLSLERLWGVDQKKKTGRDLDLQLHLVDGKLTAGVGFAPQYNRSAHRVQVARIDLDNDGRSFQGRLEVAIYPDRWVPQDGGIGRVAGTIRGKLRPGSDDSWTLEGSYEVKHDGRDITGKLSGQVTAGSGAKTAILPGRLFAGKIDGLDFPEMELQIAMDAGKVDWARFGMTWHRWAHRWVAVDPDRFQWDPKRRTLTAEIPVPARAVDVTSAPEARYILEFDGAMVGDLFATTITARPVDSPGLPKRVFNGGSRVWDYGGGGKLQPDRYSWMYKIDTKPWFQRVDGFRPPRAGEHPRLLFRKDQIAEIRARARTETGKKIVQRLRILLGNNGQRMQNTLNRVKPANHNHSDLSKPAGSMFTSFHAPGYAMLYQVTGDREYAALARKAVEMMFDGAIDRDNRYAWTRPGTVMRTGSLLASVALAYDLAYDAWDPEFRKKVARALQDYNQPVAGGEKRVTIEMLAGRTGYPPTSNHYGSFVGGLTAMLAISGDPGVDQQRIEKRIAEFEQMIPHFFSYGMGQGGWYQEGPHPSRLSTNGGLIEALQALRNVTGRDYITARANPQFVTMRWVMWLTRDGSGRPVFLNRGTYGDDSLYGRAPMLSHSGDFAFGFGAIDQKYVPAALWTYKTFVETWEQGGAKPGWMGPAPSFNAFVYPHHAVHALVNWPIDVEPVNPAEVLEHHVVDTVNDFFVSRNRWKDAEDIVVTFSTGGGPWGYHRPQSRGKVHFRAFGRKMGAVSRFGHFRPTDHAAADDGSFTLGMVPFFGEPRQGALAVDLSGESGAELVIVTSDASSRLAEEFEKQQNRNARSRERGRDPYGGLAIQEKMFRHDGRVFIVTTVDKEAKPAVSQKDDTVRVGQQTYRFDGRRFRFAPVD